MIGLPQSEVWDRGKQTITEMKISFLITGSTGSVCSLGDVGSYLNGKLTASIPGRRGFLEHNFLLVGMPSCCSGVILIFDENDKSFHFLVLS